MSREQAKHYHAALSELTNVFQNGLAASVEMLSTLLEKQHFQAAADVWPFVSKNLNAFGSLLESRRSDALEALTSFDRAPENSEEGLDEAGDFSSEAGDPA